MEGYRISESYRIMHFGDTHLGRKQPSRIAEERVESTLKAFRFCVEKAVEKDVDLVLHAGDVFDTVYPWHTVIEKASKILEVLEEEEIPIYMIRGNHDRSYGRGREVKGLAVEHLENNYVHLVDPSPEEFGEPAVDLEPVEIYGWGYHSSRTPEVLEDFEPGDKTSILLMHDFVEGVTRTYSDDHISAEELSEKGLDYVAIGHDHQPETWKKVNGTVFAATGGTVDYDFNNTEFGNYYNIIEAGSEGVELEETGQIPQTLELKKMRVPVEEARVEPLIERARNLSGERKALKLMIKGKTDKDPEEIPVKDIESRLEEIDSIEMAEVVLDLEVKGYEVESSEGFNVEEFLEDELENPDNFKRLHRETSEMLSEEQNLTSTGLNLKKEARQKLSSKVEDEFFGDTL